MPVSIFLNGSNGTFNFSANTSITNPSGTVITINTSTAGDITTPEHLPRLMQVLEYRSMRRLAESSPSTEPAPKRAYTTTSNAISLTNNTGAVINFSGNNLLLTTTSGTGFNATAGGTISVTGAGKTLLLQRRAPPALNVSADQRLGPAD